MGVEVIAVLLVDACIVQSSPERPGVCLDKRRGSLCATMRVEPQTPCVLSAPLAPLPSRPGPQGSQPQSGGQGCPRYNPRVRAVALPPSPHLRPWRS